MFKCAITGKMSKPGDKAIRLVTSRRERFYFETKDGVEDVESGDPIGQGWEIESEVNVTLEGLGIWVAKNPEDIEASLRYKELFDAEQRRRQNAIREGSRHETT